MKYLGLNWTNKDFEGLRALLLPSGIGEFQWAWTKLYNANEQFAIFGLDGAPRRLHQFVELHDNVEMFGYSTAMDYTGIRNIMKMFDLTTWESVRKHFPEGSICPIACNPHLEAGKPLVDWLPDLPITYNYPLRTRPSHQGEVLRYFDQLEDSDILIGISCASYRGSEAWHTWGLEEWSKFLHLVAKEEPHVRFVLLGGSWDDLTASVLDENLHLRWLTDSRGIPPVGRTTFGGAVEMLRRLHGYVGFSSGLGHVAAHNCGTPVFMLWPEHEQPLSRSWVNPELLENGFYVPSRWLAPEAVFAQVKPWMRRILDGSYKRQPAY